MRARDQKLNAIAARFKVTAEEVEERIETLINDKKRLEKELADVRKAAVLGGGADSKPELVNGINFLGKILIKYKCISTLILQFH